MVSTFIIGERGCIGSVGRRRKWCPNREPLNTDQRGVALRLQGAGPALLFRLPHRQLGRDGSHPRGRGAIPFGIGGSNKDNRHLPSPRHGLTLQLTFDRNIRI